MLLLSGDLFGFFPHLSYTLRRPPLSITYECSYLSKLFTIRWIA